PQPRRDDPRRRHRDRAHHHRRVRRRRARPARRRPAKRTRRLTLLGIYVGIYGFHTGPTATDGRRRRVAESRASDLVTNRATALHTEEVTGSNPVSPTERGPLTSGNAG